MSNIIFCLMGPTASGKTALACELVQKFPLEIISVDSAMIYRGLDIGTAKPDKDTLKKVPHHLIDILDPTESYSAAQFCEDVERLCVSISSRGKIPLLTGGTMMYFRALQQGISELPSADHSLRKQILAQAQEKGWDFLHQRLREVDPVAGSRIHPHDTQRIQRALEVYELTAKPLSDFLDRAEDQSQAHFTNLLLIPENRQWLHERIALRFLQMLKEGFIDEVSHLLTQWNIDPSLPSMRSVGYRQVFAYLQGECDYAAMREKGIAATRQLAKRQLTWLRHWPHGYKLTAEDPNVLDTTIAIVKKILDNTQL